MKKILLVVIVFFCSPVYSWTSLFKSCDEKWEAAWERCATCDTLPDNLRPNCEPENFLFPSWGGKDSNKRRERSESMAKFIAELRAERALIKIENMSIQVKQEAAYLRSNNINEWEITAQIHNGTQKTS